MTQEQSIHPLSALEASTTAALTVQHPSGMPLLLNGEPLTITLYGPGSEEYQRAQARIDQAVQARTFAALRGKAQKDDPEDLRRWRAEKLTACTASCSAPGINVAELYTNPRLGYIANQVEKFVEDWANFLPSAPTV